ncbi:DUF2059 domain-containing protein [Sinorhizobium sp. BG8]|uniref:DUF2059 domain-containing protein n=1 Tax=Sinorhizobium sp. BG8 TaxID=2613773 RepID=UPI00193E5B26|nr:DUF2059 domain-containing protein [Sinorhizobium sp. BG8]QRM55687.1 DUF2059 domain-containing protein [Sinorhizobium sp. BG8]
MIKFTGFGRTIASSLVVTAALLGAAQAQEVSEEQVKAARATIDALGVTANFDNILPSVAERLKGTLIQSSPNYESAIASIVDGQALALAPRRADLEREAANIYAKTFTTDELKAIAEFYNSPAGKKLLKDGPIAARELIKAADIWGAGISRDLAVESDKKLQEQIKAEGGAQPAATQQ